MHVRSTRRRAADVEVWPIDHDQTIPQLDAGLLGLLFLLVPVMGVATFVLAPMYNIWLPRDVSEHGRVIDSCSCSSCG